ncbi:hypothetical protein [Clostridium septicum]|uniref:Uncharacterized protein n=1 Tax=Clostridium septicum TaxID=1504 RepID=A0A9N7JP56_CLOSE|nr:hypothetical protein [Clostridium septicum]AYE35570.1 hypothetical protein CP523_14650 [Clostridium septicum]MDU1314992.1 hypothetical protein [Clostridium septicum]QAS60956.1 hypothetical protein EI377_09615 [Clostridium septicum]UEC19767.1 hypothetical protein LK444_10095 [Clostridium septicum]USS02173.1 hypothetical protein NH397_07075 [Clostridium septicum]
MGFWNLFKKKINEEYEDSAENYEEEIDTGEHKVSSVDIEYEFSEGIKNEVLQEKSIQEKEERVRKLSPEEINELITNEILNVIENHDDFEKLKESASEAVKNIGDEYMYLMPQYLIDKLPRPKNLREQYDMLDEWPMVVENAVLMILFSYQEKGVEYLSKIAYRNSSVNISLRLKAINLLCKLAADGVDCEGIVNKTMNNLMAFDDENKIKIFGFMSQIKSNNQVIGLIQHFYKSFVKHGDIEYGYNTLLHLINAAEKYTPGHLNFLKMVALGKGTINLEEIMGLEENEEKVIYIKDINEKCKVRAAITYYSLEKTDSDINSKLYYWSEYSLDKYIREEIKQVISEG